MQEKRTLYKKIGYGFALFWLLIGVFFLGIFSTRFQFIQTMVSPKPIFAETTIQEGKDLGLFWRVWEIMETQYPFKEKNPDTKNKIYGAISGLVHSYNDPYTVFFPPKEARLFSDSVRGSFGGVGMEIGLRNGLITIIAPLKNSPADQAGILAGDVIVKINNQSTDTMDIDTAISLIRGERGTSVTLELARTGERDFITKTITRDTIRIPTLETKEYGDVFAISLFSFTENSASLFKQALDTFLLSGKEKLLIDLRNNPGGYLDSAVDIASFFLPQDKVIVQEFSGNQSDTIVQKSYGYHLVQNKKIIILINEGSASASEILAGALAEHGYATTVGRQTFGKGSVQQVINLPDKSALKITVAKWLTPKGVSISEKGITPMIAVEEKAVFDQKTNTWSDPILERALQEFKKMK